MTEVCAAADARNCRFIKVYAASKVYTNDWMYGY